MNKPKIVCLSAISASGKSTYAKKFCAENPEFVRICADDLRLELCGDESDQSNNHVIFTKIMPERVKRAIADEKSVIIDITSPDRKSRKTVIQWARDNNVEIESHFIRPDLERSIRWNKQRERQVPEWVLEKQLEKWTEPTLSEGFAKIVEIKA